MKVSGEVLLERMVRAVEKVRDRLLRATRALESAGVPYAVVGGNAVAAWVADVDPAAVRNTQDVDILLRRCDLDRAIAAMSEAGFIYRHVRSIDMFLDGPGAKARDAVHVVFAKEKVKDTDPLPTPDVLECEPSERFRLIRLDALVRMKLTSYRRKDQVHLLDMLEVGLIDQSWIAKVQAELAPRFQQLLDNPD
jgi:hypothetical protein